MIQYQIEKIRMLENAINIVSINNARTECDEMPARMLTSEYVCISSASVKKAFAAITARKSACLRLSVHSDALSNGSPMRTQ